MSNLTINGSNNQIELSNSLESTCIVNGSSNQINAGVGNYDVTVKGSDNEVSMTEGVGYVVFEETSADNVLNGNNSEVTVVNFGTNTLVNNCDTIIKATSDINLQVGINGDESSQIKISTGFMTGRLSFNVSNSDYAEGSVEKADSLIQKITEKVTEIGSQYSRLSSALEANEIEQTNQISAKSTLQDADVAELTSEYVKNIILQQSSSILSVTAGNISTENVLRLLQAL